MSFLEYCRLGVLIILLIISLVFLAYAILNLFFAAPFVPSSRKRVKEMIGAADLKKNDTVYDLGSGDGRLIIAAAKKGVKMAIGFEINPVLNIYAKVISKVFRLKNTLFMTKSLWNANLSKCDKLFIYLLPKTMSQLEAKVIAEMKPGSLIISHGFSFPNLKPVKDLGSVKVYEV